MDDLHRSDSALAAEVARLWPLDGRDDEPVTAALRVPAGVVALDERLTSDAADLDPRWSEALEKQLMGSAFRDLACAALMLGRPARPGEESVRERLADLLSDFADSATSEEVATAAPHLVVAAGAQDGGPVHDVLSPILVDPDAAAGLLLSADRWSVPAEPSLTLRTAAGALDPAARNASAAAALLAHAHLAPADRSGLRERHPDDGLLGLAGLLDPACGPAEHSACVAAVTRAFGQDRDEKAVAAAVVQIGSGLDRIVGALEHAVSRKLLETVAEWGAAGGRRAALVALRLRAARSRSDVEVDVQSPQVGEQVLHAAGGPGGPDALRADAEAAEAITYWWARHGFESPSRDLLPARSFAARLSQPLSSAHEGAVVRVLGSVAVVRWCGLLGLVPGSELMAALDADGTWEPGRPLDGSLVGTRARLRAVRPIEGIHALLLAAAPTTSAALRAMRPTLKPGDRLAGIGMGRRWIDLPLTAEAGAPASACLWVPAAAATPGGCLVIEFLVDEGVDGEQLRRERMFTEVPVIYREDRRPQGRRSSEDMPAFVVDLRGMRPLGSSADTT